METVSAFSSPSSSRQSSKKINRPEAIPGLASLSLPGPGLEPGLATSHCRSLFHRGPAEVLSPLTNLALNMGNLAVLGRYNISPSHKCCCFYNDGLGQLVLCVWVFLTATATPQRGSNIPRWKKSLPLLLTYHLIQVSAHGLVFKTIVLW